MFAECRITLFWFAWFVSAQIMLGAQENRITGHHYFLKSSHEHHPRWGYHGDVGPKHWGSLDPSFSVASTGAEQSPIDITKRNLITRNSLPPISFDYRIEQVSALNNGHTIQHQDSPGSFLLVGEQKFSLEQFHVHCPSEHTIEGKHFPMELHFVHRLASRVAVVAVLVQESNDSDLRIPHYELPNKSGELIAFDDKFNPEELIPADHSYYHYRGSFTTPPCHEGVEWYVMQNPIQGQKNTIKSFAELLNHNNRPVQNLNGRSVDFRN